MDTDPPLPPPPPAKGLRPSPALISTLPPEADLACVAPARRLTQPPSFSRSPLASPRRTVKFPLDPCLVTFPVARVKEPDSPRMALPVVRVTAPLSLSVRPTVPALGVSTLNFPLEDDPLDPVSMRIEPPVVLVRQSLVSLWRMSPALSRMPPAWWLEPMSPSPTSIAMPPPPPPTALPVDREMVPVSPKWDRPVVTATDPLVPSPPPSSLERRRDPEFLCSLRPEVRRRDPPSPEEAAPPLSSIVPVKEPRHSLCVSEKKQREL